MGRKHREDPGTCGRECERTSVTQGDEVPKLIIVWDISKLAFISSVHRKKLELLIELFDLR